MSTELWDGIWKDCQTPEYHFGTYRAVSPSQTLRRIRPMMPMAGITRLSDVTGLDYIGVPVYQSVRPHSRNMSLSNGKGLTRTQAKVSALMESIESFHAEAVVAPVTSMSIEAMCERLAYDPYSLAVARSPEDCMQREFNYDPFAPPCGQPAVLSDETIISWIPATDLSDGSATYAPKDLCELNYCIADKISPPLFRATSNGLAGGNSLVESLIHGLSEVVERDSIWRGAQEDIAPQSCIDPATVRSRSCQRLMSLFARVKMAMQIVDITGPTGIPCFEVYLGDRDYNAYKGMGCHPSRVTALIRALTEAAQSRLGHIAGTRDDLFRRTYRSGLSMPQQLESGVFSIPCNGNFEDSSDIPIKGWADTFMDIVNRIHRVTGMPPLGVDLTRSDFRIPVTFVLAPGLRFLPPTTR